MSLTGVVLYVGARENLTPLNQIFMWLAMRDPAHRLLYVRQIGLMDLFAGALEGFEPVIEPFRDFVMRLPWQWPENVVLTIQPEEGPTRVFHCLAARLFGGQGD